MKAALVLTALLASPACADSEFTESAANPIRKVVGMLQNMQKKVQADGEAEQELFDKFMCYCKNGAAALDKSIADAGDAVPELGSNIDAGESQKVQLQEDLKKAETDRAAAKVAQAEATAIREKGATAFAEESGKIKGYLADLHKAITAIEGGMVGAFLQTSAANTLRDLVSEVDGMADIDRQDVTAFLTGGNSDPDAAAQEAADEQPAAVANQTLNQSTPMNASVTEVSSGGLDTKGAITGILKQMADRMNKKLGEAVGEEDASIKSYDELMAAKKAEVKALTTTVEEKTVRIGELGVEIVQMKKDLSDTEGSLLDDKKFAADLEKNCATKEAEWAEVCKTRSQEVLALADTIKILNDDDALEMFKKTLPSASASFMQVQGSDRTRALAILQDAKAGKKADRHRVDFIMLALRGKTVGFSKVVKMIDDMVALLRQEAFDDQAKKEYCEKEFDEADDQKKELEYAQPKIESAIANAKESVASLKEQVVALGHGIEALDKSVAEATDQRREENSDYKTLMMHNQAAKELLQFAKNRLNKFYNPKLYRPPAMFMQISAHVVHRGKAEPGPPPAAPGAHKKQDGNGVIAMIDILVKGLDTEMTEAEVNEKHAQEEYEEMMADSASKRAADTKSIADKSSAQADNEALIVTKGRKLASTKKELMATHQYIGNLHSQCDWLLKFFDMRAEARNGEMDSLKKAKAVLSGADFSLAQKSAKRFLRK